MKQVLDLTEVMERDTVKMPDGVEYELRNYQELSALEHHKIDQLRTEAAELEKLEEPTEEDAVKASELIQKLARMLIVDLQEEVSDWVCVRIWSFWVKKYADSAEALAEELNPQAPPRPRTTAASSRGSKRSTAATRKAGSTPRRGS